MHEMSIAQGLIEIVKDEMTKNNALRLTSVRVNIGEMSGIVPNALESCFDIMTAKDEIMKGAVLKIDISPLTGYCGKCDENFRITDYVFSCPHCRDKQIEIVTGREMNIVELEVE